MLNNEPKHEPSIYRSLQDEVVNAAKAHGITVSQTEPYARTLIQDETNFVETPRMFFEDVLQALQAAEGWSAPEDELLFVKAAARTTHEAVECLRNEHRLVPLTGLEKVEEPLRQRVQELLYRSLQDEVVAAARAVGITLSPDDPLAWEYFENLEDYKDTPKSLFEDVIQELQILEVTEPEKEGPNIRSAAISTRKTIALLRDEHHIKPLTGLEKVEEALWKRAEELKEPG